MQWIPRLTGPPKGSACCGQMQCWRRAAQTGCPLDSISPEEVYITVEAKQAAVLRDAVDLPSAWHNGESSVQAVLAQAFAQMAQFRTSLGVLLTELHVWLLQRPQDAPQTVQASCWPFSCLASVAWQSRAAAFLGAGCGQWTPLGYYQPPTSAACHVVLGGAGPAAFFGCGCGCGCLHGMSFIMLGGNVCATVSRGS